MYIFERLYNYVYCYLEWYRVVWTYMHNWLYASCIIGFMHHWIDLCITEYIYASLNNLHASLNRLMHHWIYASLSWLMHHWIYYASFSWLMHHWIYWCIIEYTDASLNIPMHNWIYLCIIEWIYASAGHQLDLCIIEWIYASAGHQLDLSIMEGIYASWNEFMHQPWLTYRRFIFLRQYCRYMFVIAPGHRWLVDVSSHGVTIADDLWTCYVLSMTCESVITLGSGWLTNVSWWVSLTY